MEKTEIRAVIKYFCKKGMPPKEIHEDFIEALGKVSLSYILNETSKPPLDIFSYILIYIIHTMLQFTLNMEKLITQNLLINRN